MLGALLLLLGPLGTAPSYAVPEAAPGTAAAPVPSPIERALERQVDRREHALTAMFAVAEQHAHVEQVRSDRLRALGYTGDLPALETILPLGGYHLTAGFGAAGGLWEADHTGLDFGAPSGTDLVALADATVSEVAYAGPYGLRTVLTLPTAPTSGTATSPCPWFARLGRGDRRARRARRVHRQHHRSAPAPGGAPRRWRAADPDAWLDAAGMTP